MTDQPPDPMIELQVRWVHAISWLSALTGKPAMLSRNSDLRWQYALWWSPESDTDDDPQWNIALKMTEGDTPSISISVEHGCMDDGEEPHAALLQRVVGWAVIGEIPIEPSRFVGEWGIKPVPLMTEAQMEEERRLQHAAYEAAKARAVARRAKVEAENRNQAKHLH